MLKKNRKENSFIKIGLQYVLKNIVGLTEIDVLPNELFGDLVRKITQSKKKSLTLQQSIQIKFDCYE